MSDLDFGATIKGLSSGQKVFARYTLKKILGRGGMGVVWLARDDKLDRDVALKFLPEVVMSDRSAMEELKHETRRALELTHSNIVRIYDFVEDAAAAAISMEFVSGDTLANSRMDQPGRIFEAASLRRVTRQLCDALAYAHGKARIVHRDLKPANLLLDAHGDLKIADFGIARSISDSVSRISAQAGSSGTPVYMSPQQMMGEKPAVTDDIYALGATLYELLTGKPPFYTGNVLLQVQNKVPPAITDRRHELELSGATIPAEWEDTIAACLAKDAAQRPASAHAVAQRLGLVSSGPTSAPFEVQPEPAKPKPVAVKAVAPPARRTWLYAVGAAAVLAGAGFGYYFMVMVPQQRAEAEQAARRQADEQAKAQTARATEELRSRIQANAVPVAELEAIARESSPRSQLARDRLQETQRQRESAEQQSYQLIAVAIERLADNAPRASYDELDSQVRAYLAAAPARLKADAEKSWERRRTAWQAYEAANRPGTLLVETEPAGATVILYPRNERRTSPAVFRDLKPGEVSFRVEKEGYESQDTPFAIKPGQENKPETVRLAPLFGSVAVTSDPSGLRVVVEGSGRRHEGITPFTQSSLPAGAYRVTFQREAWQPQEKQLVVERGKDAQVFAELRGVNLEIRSEPAGAMLTVDGRPAGVTPLRLAALEPRTYQLAASLEGYDGATLNYSAKKDETVSLTLREPPLRRALRLVVGHTYRYDNGWGYAELAFDLTGRITGTHKIPLAPVATDGGQVNSYNEATRTLSTTLGQTTSAFPFYTGTVSMTIVDEDSVRVVWVYSGKTLDYLYRRTDAAGTTPPVTAKGLLGKPRMK
ncbi:MAG: protein kinase [Lacunisphaera sp.]|nr:protein kinase [Lacunisphaera sp.]